jgi:hypothetical protein
MEMLVSGNGNNGVVHSATLASDRFGNPNSAYRFNGNSSYIEVVNGSSFNFVNDFSISTWVNPASLQITYDYPSILNKYGVWAIIHGGGTINIFTFNFVVSNGDSYGSADILLVNNIWNHLAITKKDVTIRCYLNNILTGKGNASATSILSNGNMPLFSGASSSLGSFFHGLLDDIRIYNRTLSGGEVSQLYSLGSPTSQPSSHPSSQPTLQPSALISGTLNQGLVAYYPFDGNARDQSGNGNNGEVHNATLTSDRFGTPNTAYSFDGVRSYIKVNNGLPFDFTDSFSVAFWIKPGASQLGWATVFSKSHYITGGGSGSSWFIEQDGTELNSYILSYRPSTSNAIPNSVGTQLLANQWNHYSVTKENTKLNSYLNGNLVYSLSGLGNDPIIKTNGNLPLFIGVDDGSYGLYFHGLIDDIFIFNRTLTPQEIQKLYQFDAPTSQPTSQPTRLPSPQPSRQPSEKPTAQPSSQPSSQPSPHPSNQPTNKPSRQPSGQPSDQPSAQPTNSPSNQPTSRPSLQPVGKPTGHPSNQPTSQPTNDPSTQPTRQPSMQPTIQPSGHPTVQPSIKPTSFPSVLPSQQPNSLPTKIPSIQPTVQPSCVPTIRPTGKPSAIPSRLPSRQASSQPSIHPSISPSDTPSSQPTVYPTNHQWRILLQNRLLFRR